MRKTSIYKILTDQSAIKMYPIYLPWLLLTRVISLRLSWKIEKDISCMKWIYSSIYFGIAFSTRNQMKIKHGQFTCLTINHMIGIQMIMTNRIWKTKKLPFIYCRQKNMSTHTSSPYCSKSLYRYHNNVIFKAHYIVYNSNILA